VLDENLRGPIWAALQRANARRTIPLEIACVGEEADLPLAVSDPELLRWAEEHKFIVVSNDVRTMPVHHRVHLQAGRHCPGVFLIELPAAIPRILDALFYYAEESDDDLWYDQLVYIP
jgi:hypothetical protein